jgi:hypothetical protein
MTAYFYCSPISLDVGSVVRPDNWTRILRTGANCFRRSQADFIAYFSAPVSS